MFYAFHISSPLKGHWTISHLSPEPPALTQAMSCAFSTPKNHDPLKPKAALWEGPDDVNTPQGSSWGKQGLHTWTWMCWWVPVPRCGPNHILFFLSTWACWAVLRRVVEKSGIDVEQCAGLLTQVSEMGMGTLTGITRWAVAFVLCSVSNKNQVYVLGTMQRTWLVIASTALCTAFYRLARLLCLNNCTKEESITYRFYSSKGCFLSAPSSLDLGGHWSIALLAGRLDRVTEGLGFIFSFNFSLILWSVSSIRLFRSYDHQYFGKNIQIVIMVWIRPFLIISIDFDVLILSVQDNDLNLVLFRKQIHVQIGSRCVSFNSVPFKMFLTADVWLWREIAKTDAFCFKSKKQKLFI